MRGRPVFAGALYVATLAAAFAQENRWQSLMDRGVAAETAGDYAGASEAYREAATLAETFPRDDQRRVLTFNSQGLMYDALGRLTDAEASYRRALDALNPGLPASSLNRAVLLANLATVSVEMGNGARAEKLLRESIAIHLSVEPPNELRLSMARNSLAELLTVTGRIAEASTLLETSLATLERLPDAGTEIGIARNNLGAVRLFQGRYAEAQTMLEQSLAALEAARGPGHPILLRTLHNLAAARLRNGQRRSAGDAWRRATDLAEATIGIEHPLYGEILGNYAAYLRETGDKAAAKALATRSDQILRDHRRRNGIGGVVDITSLRQGAK